MIRTSAKLDVTRRLAGKAAAPVFSSRAMRQTGGFFRKKCPPMTSDDDFEPYLGRIRTTRARGSRRYLHRMLGAANLAGGGAAGAVGKGGFSGSRIGRGAGVGRVLGSRDRFSAFRQRRVIIKSRIVKLAGKGMNGAKAHLRYLQRDGVTREGERGALYSANADRVDGKAFLERGAGDRHQFRFIVSPEDGAEHDDLASFTRRLMARMEEDLGTKLDWVAVDHFNTGHPHSHILLRGVDMRGKDLVIARDYLTSGMRERAAQLLDLDLGPRSDRDIERHLRAEIDQERLTSIDRQLLRESDVERIVTTAHRDSFDQALRAGRLAKLGRLGLAEDLGSGKWRLAEGLEASLKRLGERGDIIRTMQRAYAETANAPAFVDRVIYDPAAPEARPLVGRLVERGLSDELHDRHYGIIEATDGRSHYVELGKGEESDALKHGAILEITPSPSGIREVDRTIVAVAAAHDGRYDVDTHLRHDPQASEAFAQSHVRRLEAIRRKTGAVEREADGRWVITPDHLDKVAAYEQTRVRERPVAVTVLSSEPLEKLIGADAATWLDREMVVPVPAPLREAGFGQEVQAAQAQRRQWLIEQGLAEEREGSVRYRPDMIAQLQRRELLRVAGQLSDELGLRFVEVSPSERFEGVLKRSIDLASGRFALIEKSREFTLVPWRPVLERQIGKQVSGMMRANSISWSFGRGRKGPEIS